MAHYSYFVLTNSTGTLAKRFRVVMPGYEISLEKAQSIGHTLDGDIDVAMGDIHETHNYIIRVRQEEDDDDYPVCPHCGSDDVAPEPDEVPF